MVLISKVLGFGIWEEIKGIKGGQVTGPKKRKRTI
jgi:hypothetical protein